MFLNCSLVDEAYTENIYHSSEEQEQGYNRNCDIDTAASITDIEEKLRRRLAFHFMDPVEKFIARRQVPWKLLLQFLKGKMNILNKSVYFDRPLVQ